MRNAPSCLPVAEIREGSRSPQSWRAPLRTSSRCRWQKQACTCVARCISWKKSARFGKRMARTTQSAQTTGAACMSIPHCAISVRPAKSGSVVATNLDRCTCPTCNAKAGWSERPPDERVEDIA